MKISKTCTILSLFILFSASSFAIDENDVSQMLDQFKAKGIIDAKGLADAKAKLGKISPEKWKKINSYAENQGDAKSRTPTSNNIDAAAANIDTDSPEFQKAMADMKKIMFEQKTK